MATFRIAPPPEEPYNDLPLLPPAVDLESKRVMRALVSATREVAELKGAGDLVPDQTVLLQTALLREARLSSEIENIVTTNDEIYRGFSADAETADPATKEVLHYTDALWHGYQQVSAGQPLSARLFVDLVRIIKGAELDVRDRPGTRIGDPRRGSIVYSPPEGEDRIRRLLDNLSDYLYAEDGIDPLIKMAVAHYQFEAIHPFTDGNGRTGRIVNVLYLVDQGLLRLPILYLSGYILSRRSAYYEGLRLVTCEAAWEPWLLYMLEGIEQTARDTADRLRALQKVLVDAIPVAREALGSGYSKELVELVFRQPYCKIGFLQAEGIAKRQTAAEYLRRLENAGILKSEKRGRDVYFRNEWLVQALNG